MKSFNEMNISEILLFVFCYFLGLLTIHIIEFAGFQFNIIFELISFMLSVPIAFFYNRLISNYFNHKNDEED